jgi:hypothetical protein
MGAGAIAILFVLATALGAVAQFLRTSHLRTPRTGYDWAIVTAVGLLTGALAGAIRPIGPKWEGIYIGPSVVALVVWSIVIAAVLRFFQRAAVDVEG